jgi:two-component system, chemotaxis family, chemotaxis protein CheY
MPFPQVLIVDDDAFMRAVLRDALTPMGYELREAHDGEQALASLKEQPADLVLLDLVMPRKSGLEVLRALKAWPVKPRVLIISSMDAQALVDQALADGALGFLGKPTHPLEVQEQVRLALEDLT